MDGGRSFLLLQGPISSCFDRLGRALLAHGHRVHRVNFHLGDQLFWRLPATHFRGRFAEWRGFVAGFLEQHEVTDLILHGDRRPYHIVAAEEARARGIAVIVTDLGYVRPDWITLEQDGMTTYSRFPSDPAAIQALAANLPEPKPGPHVQTPFWLIAVLDVAYNLALVFGRPLYPHYRYHSTCHPFAEYAGWLWSRPKKLAMARAVAAEKRRLQATPGSYFLVPLQLSTDFQIRAHSPFSDLREAVHGIVASFAGSGSERKLIFVVHPHDNGLIDWGRLVARLARSFGVAGRVFALDGGTPPGLLRNSAGVVTVNSTVGVTALRDGIPVKALGNAVFNVAGLTCQASLDEFWHDPQPPDRELLAAFLRALIGTTQVTGGYYERPAQDCGIVSMVERLEERPYPLPALGAAELAARPPRPVTRNIVVTGVSDPVGVALARGYAAPGVRLSLIGEVAETLGQAAADCRQRGALVETFCLAETNLATLEDHLAAFDRNHPVDALVVHPDAADLASLVTAIGDKMRERGRGEIVLTSPVVAGVASGDPATALRLARAFLTDGAALRRRSQTANVFVTVVAPTSLAIRAAAWWREPALAMVSADRLAEQTLRGVRRHRAVIRFPAQVSLLRRVMCLLVARARYSARALSLPSATALGEPADGASIAGKSATGAAGD